MLLGLDYDTVDHLGPKHKLFDVDFFNNKTNKHIYIYIGDVNIAPLRLTPINLYGL